MYFPLELWREIKDYAGIYSISTEWSFPYLYDGNWIQFYLEWLKPTIEDLDQIHQARDIQQAFLTRAMPYLFWKRVHHLHQLHEQHRHNAILPVLRNCNALLEIDTTIFTKGYDMIEIYIPFLMEEDELKLLQSIHALLDRCRLTRIFYCYQKYSLILSVHI